MSVTIISIAGLTSRLATATVATSLVPPYRVLEKFVTMLAVCPARRLYTPPLAPTRHTPGSRTLTASRVQIA